jgi:hypothetical protein
VVALEKQALRDSLAVLELWLARLKGGCALEDLYS